MNELKAMQEFIGKVGPTKLVHVTGISRRALHYIAKGDNAPSYKNAEALRQAMADPSLTPLAKRKSAHRRSGKPTAHELGK